MSYQDDPLRDPGEYAKVIRSIETQRIKKATEHLLGICTGLIADSRIEPAEILFLRTWLNDNQELTEEWPGRAIAQRLNMILDDGFITAAECNDLLETLRDITANAFIDSGSPSPSSPSLPIDDDPSIFFSNMTFCLTGRFLWGTRAACERAILGLNGTMIDNITQRLDYLVIGSMIEPQWAQTTYGRKIEKAMKYKNDGHDITIVSERQWESAIEDISRRHRQATP